jgi:hypothetical protein
MADRIIEELVHTDGGGGITAIAIVLLVIALLALLYFTKGFGMFGNKKTEVDVNINKPGIVLQLR